VGRVFVVFGLVNLIAAQTTDPGLLERYSNEGEQALAANRYDEAAKAYEKLRQLSPGNAEVHAKLGLIYFQQGNFSTAVTVLRQALKLKPNLPNAGTLLAMSLSEVGRYKEALPELEKAFVRSTDPVLKRMAGLQLQRAYTGLQRDSDAVRVALELTRAFPDDPEILYHSGRLFGNYAYLTTMRLSRVAPDSVWTLLAVAEAQESQGAYDLAIAHYRKVLSLDPGRPGVHYRLGRALLSRSQKQSSPAADLADAAKEFEQELKLDATNANAAYELGEIHRTSGEFEKARQFFEIALKHYPDFQEAEVGMGRAFLALRKPDLALAHLRKAISLNSKDDVAYYHLSQAYGALNNLAEQQKAIAEFRRLRSERSRQEDIFLQRAVTKQEIDPAP
jgi:tetratricopeptide (TPR) repeat protein